MTLKELSQLYYIRREIEYDIERLRTLRGKLMNFGGIDYSGIPKGSGSNGDQKETYLDKITELETVIAEKQYRAVQEQIKLEKYIATIPDSLTRQIFTLRFVENYSWKKVAYFTGIKGAADTARKICFRYLQKESESS